MTALLSPTSERARAWSAWLATLDEVELVAWDVWQRTHEVPEWPWRCPRRHPKLGDVWGTPEGVERVFAVTASRVTLGSELVFRRGVCTGIAGARDLSRWRLVEAFLGCRLLAADDYQGPRVAPRTFGGVPPGWAEALEMARGEVG